MVNEFVPEEVGYINEVLGKKALRDIIGKVIKICGVARTAQFLDDIKAWVIIWHSRVFVLQLG